MKRERVWRGGILREFFGRIDFPIDGTGSRGEFSF
jgi:hypothetical protein